MSFQWSVHGIKRLILEPQRGETASWWVLHGVDEKGTEVELACLFGGVKGNLPEITYRGRGKDEAPVV
jgi:hypothetical protein